MSLANLLRVARTVRHLRARQVLYRLYYAAARGMLLRRMEKARIACSRRSWLKEWEAPRAKPRSFHGGGDFEFLGERGRIGGACDWNDAAKSKLWLYNLHYLDDLDAADGDARCAQQGALIDRWIGDNPPARGIGWEPYPLSLRIVNLIKWLSRNDAAQPQRLASLAHQAEGLACQVEYHILGNHLLSNGKALVFAGAFFQGDDAVRWLDRGLSILDREMREQFLDDGAHFELSPMYHAALLWDVCDLLHLAECCALPQLTRRAEAWRKVLARGLEWLTAMCHPDGGISFFNDAAFGIAPTLQELAGYVARLHGGSAPARGGARIEHLANSGYVAIAIPERGKLLLDVAEVGPGYQPGHAHADTLSFELSLFGQRVLVNSGTSRYGDDDERRRQRGTAAHNTVSVDGADSSEVWAGFRVARRARPLGLAIEEEGGCVSVRCAHDGYLRLPGGVIHRRHWKLAERELTVTDTIEGRFSEAIARFFPHPEVRVIDDGTLALAGGRLLRWRSSGSARMRDALWHPRFGASQASRCIEVRFAGPELVTVFQWE